MALFHGPHWGGGGGVVGISSHDTGNAGSHLSSASASPLPLSYTSQDLPLDGTPLLRQDATEFALLPSCAVASSSSHLSDYMGSPPENPTLWRPGSTSHSHAREPMDRLQSKQELQKLYEQVCDSSYDLSLRDIVDPSYSISGHLKAVVTESEISASSKQKILKHVKSGRKADTKVSPSKRRLAFSFSFPGVNGKRGSRDSIPPSTVRAAARKPCRSPSQREERSVLEPLSTSDHNSKPFKRFASADRLKSKSSPYPDRRADFNQRPFSASKVHPSNQCSSCSSYTLFFKSRCQVCGKFYCSNCAKDAMDTLSDGRKCKATCNSRPTSKRFTRKVGKSCWPFCGTTEVQQGRFKPTKSGG